MAFDFTDAREILSDRHVRTAMRRELTRVAQHRREAERYSGVAWSGMRPDPIRAKTVAEIIEEGLAERARQRRFEAAPRGRFLAGLAKIRLEAPEHAAASWKAQDAYSRGFADETQPASIGELANAHLALSELGDVAKDAREALVELQLIEHRRAA